MNPFLWAGYRVRTCYILCEHFLITGSTSRNGNIMFYKYGVKYIFYYRYVLTRFINPLIREKKERLSEREELQFFAP